MSFVPGARLGSYEIIGPLGAGGMGEVYRARDTVLNRDVAIKVLPAAVAGDAEKVARFRREAQMLAALNHPNIAQIFGMEGAMLIMEFVPGDNLKGPLPPAQVLDVARQIADALDAAHSKGIVHRDLKPANIKITPAGSVKVLDFGLAKAMEDSTRALSDADSPTISMDATRAGVILGTAGYMSPEQTRGEAVDKRADIWAFGVILYELLTGDRAFGGLSGADSMAAVLTRDPDWSRLPAGSPVAALRRCLEKDPNRRLRDIGDFRIDPDATSTVAAGSRGPVWKLAAALLAVLAAIAAFGWWQATSVVARPLIRLETDLGPDAQTDVGAAAVLSPDGTRLVFRGKCAAGPCLYSRLLDQSKAAPIAGTENASSTFFSPDGRWIGFFADGKVKKVSVDGGTPLTLAAAPDGRGGSWAADGNIVFAPNFSGPLWRVSSSGGPAGHLTEINRERSESTHRWPQLLSGGETLLFTAGKGLNLADTTIDVLTLKSGQRHTLVRGGYYGRYVSQENSNSGYLVYAHEQVLFAAPMSLARLELTGPPVPVVEELVTNEGSASAQFDMARNGTLVFRTGKTIVPPKSLAWLDKTGKQQALNAVPALYSAPRISPGGGQIALTVNDGPDSNLAVYDAARNTTVKLTFSHVNGWQIWAPDGKHIAFASERAGATQNIEWIRADGSQGAQRLLNSAHTQVPCSFSPDGKVLAYNEENPDTGWDIWTVPIDLSDPDHPKVGAPTPLIQTPFFEAYPAFSPDGRWIAYTSNESGRLEVYVRPFGSSTAGGKVAVSSSGGSMPVWSLRGSELFYASPAGIMNATYSIKDGSFAVGNTRLWADPKYPLIAIPRPFDLAPDGNRLLVLNLAGGAIPPPSTRLVFLLNFFDELRHRLAGQ